jgi:hypothetical protein
VGSLPQFCLRNIYYDDKTVTVFVRLSLARCISENCNSRGELQMRNFSTLDSKAQKILLLQIRVPAYNKFYPFLPTEGNNGERDNSTCCYVYASRCKFKADTFCKILNNKCKQMPFNLKENF